MCGTNLTGTQRLHGGSGPVVQGRLCGQTHLESFPEILSFSYPDSMFQVLDLWYQLLPHWYKVKHSMVYMDLWYSEV